MPFFYFDPLYILIVVPAMLLGLFAQLNVNRTFKKYSRMQNSRHMTGADAAMEILRHYGIFDVRIERVSGHLTDHFDPRSKVIRLSDSVYNSTSAAAIGVACHEAGHAAQYAQGYKPIKFRNAIIPICNIGSNIGIPLILIGLIFSALNWLMMVGIILYALVAVFQLVTLPVEFNASSRALQVIGEENLLAGEEYTAAKKTLRAAALTYVASLAATLATLLRFLILYMVRSNDR
ncbi:MAG TPA: zinc metallopeptidase [Candidatus Onthovicinus excrementipullorum]|nr:zinc metallopeptidase [Candidatus Onthovicinus excrementipullorum]